MKVRGSSLGKGKKLFNNLTGGRKRKIIVFSRRVYLRRKGMTTRLEVEEGSIKLIQRPKKRKKKIGFPDRAPSNLQKFLASLRKERKKKRQIMLLFTGIEGC